MVMIFFAYFISKNKCEYDSKFDYEYEKEAIAFLSNSNLKISPRLADEKDFLLNSNFTEEEIRYCINHLKNNKAPGVDSIPAELIKYNCESLINEITLLFNYILESRQFPESWCEGIRNPIFKSVKKSSPSNYRGITILPVFEKIFEICVTIYR